MARRARFTGTVVKGPRLTVSDAALPRTALRLAVSTGLTGPGSTTPVTIVAIGDSDSSVKWGAALLGQAPADWQRSLIVLASPVLPSGKQLAAAMSGTQGVIGSPPVVDLSALTAHIARLRPDIVLLSVRGPLVKVVIRVVVEASVVRPVIVSGLPGISIPATKRALADRAKVDYFVLHSRREVREFETLASRLGIEMRFGLATLPFLPQTPHPQKTKGRNQNGEIIFATQAKVPPEKADRLALLSWLAESARRHPYLRVVVKVRAARGEKQTHAERYDYANLVDQLDPPAPHNLVVTGGAMSDHLAGAVGLVTVSSAAAIEAIALSIPVIIVEDFGVSAELTNTVFDGSGLFGNCGDVVEGRFRHPDAAWLDDNYFHAKEQNNWVQGVDELLLARATGDFPLKPSPITPFRHGIFGGVLRLAWDRTSALGRFDRSLSVDVVVGPPERLALIVLRRVRSRRARVRLATVETMGEH